MVQFNTFGAGRFVFKYEILPGIRKYTPHIIIFQALWLSCEMDEDLHQWWWSSAGRLGTRDSDSSVWRFRSHFHDGEHVDDADVHYDDDDDGDGDGYCGDSRPAFPHCLSSSVRPSHGGPPSHSAKIMSKVLWLYFQQLPWQLAWQRQNNNSHFIAPSIACNVWVTIPDAIIVWIFPSWVIMYMIRCC